MHRLPCLLALLVLAPTAGACRGTKTGEPPARAEGMRITADTAKPPDRPFRTGSPKMQAEIGALLAKAPGADSSQRVEIWRRVVAYGEYAIPQLLQALRSPDPDMRITAAHLLGLLDDPRTLSALYAATRDPSQAVRFEAATAMIRIGDDRGLEVLIAGLEHADPVIRGRSISVLQTTMNETFGYRADDDPVERQAAVARWRAWFRTRRRPR